MKDLEDAVKNFIVIEEEFQTKFVFDGFPKLKNDMPNISEKFSEFELTKIIENTGSANETSLIRQIRDFFRTKGKIFALGAAKAIGTAAIIALVNNPGTCYDLNNFQTSYFIENVPYVSQPYGMPWCGHASMQMVLNYYGLDIRQEQIAETVTENLVKNFVAFAKDLGFKAEYRPLSFPELKTHIEDDIPLIAVQHAGLEDTINEKNEIVYHARVITGYDERRNKIIFNEPWDIKGEGYSLTYYDFTMHNKEREKEDCWSIVITSPKDFEPGNRAYAGENPGDILDF